MSERERAVFSFGPFQADLCAGQVTKHGIRIKMQEKPYQVLALLLERSGEVVTREELRARLWGSDTYVDFDRNLNIAVNKMRGALCDASEKPRYIETVPRKGYRFIAPVSRIPKPQAEPAGQPAGGLQPKIGGHYVWATAGIALAFLAGAGLWWSLRQRTATSTHASQVTLAVLPFTNLSGEQDTDYLRIALADQVATILSYSSGIAVRPFAATQKYAVGNLDPQAAGRELKVTDVVTGHFLREGDRLQVTLEAVEVENNQLLWTDTVKVASKDLTDLDNKISSRTQQGLIPHLTPTGVIANAGSRPQSPEAYDLYLRSLAIYHDRTANKQAIPMLERAVSLDTNYAPAWQELAQRYYFRAHSGGGDPDLDRSDTANERALALNPELPGAADNLTVSRAERGDLKGAYDAAQDFLGRRPNDAQAHGSMGYVLRYAGLVDESAREYETALRLDPTNYLLRSGAFSIQQMGDYKRAHEFLRVDAGSEWSEFAQAKIFLEERKYEEAAVAFRNSGMSWEAQMLMACLNRRRSEQVEAEAAKAEAQVLTIRDPEDRYWEAWHFSFCGLNEKALKMLRLAVEGSYLGYPSMDHEPLFANIRGTPEFAAIRALAIQRQKQFLAHRAEREVKSHPR